MDLLEATHEQEDKDYYVLRYYSLITNVGGYVYRCILLYEISQTQPEQVQTWGVAEFLNSRRSIIDGYFTRSRRILNQDQMNHLFPDGRTANSAADKFDITLLYFLLRNVIFSNQPSGKWGKPLSDISISDTSVIADVERIRHFRNKLHEFTDTKSSLSEKAFWEHFESLTRIFLRLGDHYQIKDVCQRIDKAIHEPLDDGKRRKELDIEFKQFLKENLEQIADDGKHVLEIIETMDEDRTEMKNDLGKIKKILTAKKHVDDVLADDYFVKTEQYKEALDTLQTHRIIFLQGAPGEGKTTLAKKLAKEVSKVDPIQITFLDDLNNIAPDVDTIFIDDIFGSRVFDKEESRIWQKKMPTLLTWINDSPDKDVPDTDSLERKYSPDKVDKHIVITSRTYILKQGREQLYFGNDIQEKNFFTLSSNTLTEKEKKLILEKHFKSARKRKKSGEPHFTDSNKTEDKMQEHKVLLESISRIELTTTGASFTIGFPECARLFANRSELYEIGTVFFQKPMKHVIDCIYEISKHDDDVFIAFFVLWAQKGKTLTSTDLERSVSETPECIKIPILKLQYNPENYVRTVRETLATHAHSGGFITLVSDNVFRFSHNVVRDAVGLNAFRKNATAVLELCDKAFIENYIRISKPSGDTKADEVSQNNILSLPQFRYDQLSLRIGELVICDRQEAIDTLKFEGDQDIDKTTQNIKSYTIFGHSIFDNDEFCTAFIQYQKERGNFDVLLTAEVRTITSELRGYKFLDSKAIETAIRLPSFLIWQRESLSVFAKLVFTEMKKYPNILEKEISMGMLIGPMFVSHEIVEFLSELGGKVTHKMILLAYETSKPSKLDEQKRQTCIQILESKIGVAEPNCGLKIHAAAFEERLDIVEKILENDPEQANSTYTALDSTDLQKASLYHIAAYKQNSVLIETLVRYKVESNVFDAKGRSPFLYAISKGKYKVVKVLHDIAKEHEQEMTPDDSKNTPLHMAIIKSAKERDPAKKTFTDLSVDLLKSCPSKIHTHNSRGLTPLQVACKYNATEVVKEMMIEQKIHLAEEEKTLMHDFVMSSDEKAIELLLKYGFDHNITDSNKRTPLMLANELEKTKIAAFIEELTKSHNVDPTPLEQGKNGQNLASNDKQKDRLTYD